MSLPSIPALCDILVGGAALPYYSSFAEPLRGIEMTAHRKSTVSLYSPSEFTTAISESKLKTILPFYSGKVVNASEGCCFCSGECGNVKEDSDNDE